MKRVCGSARPEGMGIVVRTAASGVADELLDADIAKLVAEWRIMAARERVAKAPCLLRRELDQTIRIVRDYLRPDLEEIIIDNVSIYKRMEELLLQIHN